MVHRADVEVKGDSRLSLRPTLREHGPEDVTRFLVVAGVVIGVESHWGNPFCWRQIGTPDLKDGRKDAILETLRRI